MQATFETAELALDAYRASLGRYRYWRKAGDEFKRIEARRDATLAWNAYVELAPKRKANQVDRTYLSDRSGFGPSVDSAGNYQAGNVTSESVRQAWSGLGCCVSSAQFPAPRPVSEPSAPFISGGFHPCECWTLVRVGFTYATLATDRLGLTVLRM